MKVDPNAGYQNFGAIQWTQITSQTFGGPGRPAAETLPVAEADQVELRGEVKPAEPEASAPPQPTPPNVQPLSQWTVSATQTFGTPQAPVTLTSMDFQNGQMFLSGSVTAHFDMRGPMTVTSLTVSYGELQPLETRYPGVVSKLENAEVQALQAGYKPGQAEEVIATILAQPPWPQGTYPDNLQRIQERARDLQSRIPALQSADVAHYDLPAAQEKAEELLETLDELFPKEQFPEVLMAARAKAPGSLQGKIAKYLERDPEYSLAHVTDTVGARVDSPDLATLGQVARKLEEHYGDQIVARSDYLSEPGVNGYRALHYIVDLGDRMAEIQMTTHDLRATDLATHDTLYKKEFELGPETAQMLETAADRIMYLESVRLVQQKLRDKYG